MGTTVVSEPQALDWPALAEMLGRRFAERAAALDEADAFAAENYAELKQHRVFSAGVPTEFGGGGASYRELARSSASLDAIAVRPHSRCRCTRTRSPARSGPGSI